MRKTLLTMLAIIAMMIFSACSTTPTQSQTDDIDDSYTGDVVEEEIFGGDYIGSWSRVSSTLDGAPQALVANTITMTKDTYVSTTSKCTLNASLAVADGAMSIITTSSDCKGYVATTYLSSYLVSEDGETLTLTNTQFGATSVEVYARI